MQHFSKIASIEMSLDVQFDTSMKPVKVCFKNSRKDTLALASLQFFETEHAKTMYNTLSDHQYSCGSETLNNLHSHTIINQLTSPPKH